MSRIVAADSRGIAAAVEALRRGELIGLPTETVYGLAADATNDQALRRVFAVKGRPSDHPLILHISDPQQLEDLAENISDSCRTLIEHAWPGPLTVVVQARESVSRVATGGLDTVAVRLPAHEVAREIIAALGRPVAAPSANRFGHVSPTSARHVAEDLGDDVEVIVDGGDCMVGVESTIVDCTRSTPRILRPGAVTKEDIEGLLDPRQPVWIATQADGVRAPGMLLRHYAPAARVVLHESLGTVPQGDPVIDCSTDVPVAARTLYSRLRDVDAHGQAVVHVVLPAPHGLGVALRDRLHKAAAGR